MSITMVTYINSKMIAYVYTLTISLGYFTLFFVDSDTSLFSPLITWVYFSICFGCIKGFQNFALWGATIYTIACIYPIYLSIIRPSLKRLVLGELLIIGLLIFPLWFSILRGLLLKLSFLHLPKAA